MDPYDNICRQSLTAMLLTFRNISIPIAASKTHGPVKVFEFMGIILDSVRMAAQLPADKTERLRAAFDLFQNKRACNLKELQSIIGAQNFACYPTRTTLSTTNDRADEKYFKASLSYKV